MKRTTMFSCLVAGLLCSACGGGGGSGGGGGGGPRLLGFTGISGVGAGTNFSFDLGLIAGDRYYLTDRTNAAVDVFDTNINFLLTQITGSGTNAFAGAKASNAVSGPNGVNAVDNLIYVGDVNSVKIIDPATRQILKTVVVGNSGTRADEGCVDAVHHLYMVATPEAATPFATFINTDTQTIAGQVTFTDAAGVPSAGLEQCRYDPGTDAFYINNDGTTAHPHGELVVLPGPAIRAIKPGAPVNYTTLAGLRTYDEGDCDPTGMALGPANELAVGCREGTTGSPLLVQIFDRTNGKLVASVNAGGGDQLEYEASTNRYYNASSRWTDTGRAALNGTCSSLSPCTPVLNIIDATTHSVVARQPSGNNAHSVAVDSATGKAFMPISSAAAPAGCKTCVANGFNDAGLLVYTIR
jgi:hypothetical protein